MNMNESISALLDGECSPAELERLLDQMERDPALREQFSRQCLARESRMGTRVRAARLDFSSKVLAALQDEQPGAVVMPFVPRVRQIPWKAATGLAAAAAVGAMAVLALKPEAPLGSSAGLPVATTSPMASDAVALPVAAAAQQPVAINAALRTGSEDEVTRQQLQNYLRAYSQSREQQHVRSLLGYARYAAYTEVPAVAEPSTADPKR
jgi:negative regulator of sigma E activity